MRLRPIHRALSAIMHRLCHHLLLLRAQARECNVARSVHLSTLPLHVGRIVAKEQYSRNVAMVLMAVPVYFRHSGIRQAEHTRWSIR